jgi:hypothetical protein
MTSYAMEQLTRERIADWHRQARDELLVQSRTARLPWLPGQGAVARSTPKAGAGRLASFRRLASRLMAAA